MTGQFLPGRKWSANYPQMVELSIGLFNGSTVPPVDPFQDIHDKIMYMYLNGNLIIC